MVLLDTGTFRTNNSALKSAYNNGAGFRNNNSSMRAGSYRQPTNMNNGGYRTNNGGYRNQGVYRNPNSGMRPNMNNGVRPTRPNYNYNQQQSQLQIQK
ncbi:hypothetical protein [Chryseobacterium indoltheticum]|uniref:hypothetical protein n=1 Tax=Chryseobacterium indoltheticum TaxID=254 RepID=UPI003F49B110